MSVISSFAYFSRYAERAIGKVVASVKARLEVGPTLLLLTERPQAAFPCYYLLTPAF